MLIKKQASLYSISLASCYTNYTSEDIFTHLIWLKLFMTCYVTDSHLKVTFPKYSWGTRIRVRQHHFKIVILCCYIWALWFLQLHWIWCSNPAGSILWAAHQKPSTTVALTKIVAGWIDSMQGTFMYNFFKSKALPNLARVFCY